MGNKQSSPPEECQFVVQSRGDFDKQMARVLRHKSTITKTVILPPGVKLDDARLADGKIVSEQRYSVEGGSIGEYPTRHPFECDIHKTLVPPAWGAPGVQAHYAIYPDDRFKGTRCGICELTARAKADLQYTKFN